MMDNSNVKETTSLNQLPIYTLAHAARSNKKSFEHQKSECRYLNQSKQTTSSFVKPKNIRIPNIKNAVLRQPRSHLPMKMVVSKMATRKESTKENEDSTCKLDLSLCRKYPLDPPPWRKIPIKSQRLSKLDRIVLSMKKKKNSNTCESSQNNYPKRLEGEPSLDEGQLRSLLFCGNSPSVMNTPRLEYNYNQLYGGHNRTTENRTCSVLLDEDPLSSDTSEDRQVLPVERRPLTPESSPQVVESEVRKDFEWNPVIVYNKPKIPLFPTEESKNKKKQYNYSRHKDQELPTCFDTPAWDSSSTSSGHTIAEETLQVTIFAQGNLAMFGHDCLQ